MKRLLSLLVLLMVLMNVSAYDFEVDGIYYNIKSSNSFTSSDNKELEVTYRELNSQDYSGDVIIPETVTYNNTEYSVTGIGDDAFFGCSSLTSITIPESMVRIGDYAFANCFNLTELYYNAKKATVSISSRRLSFPSTLTKVVIGDKVEMIPAYFIYGCDQLTTIEIPESVTSIESSAFAECSSLTSITIPENVTSIGDRAFDGCSSLTSITFPWSVTYLGNYTFCFCSSLTSITIPEGVRHIGEYEFMGCSSLTSITIPKNVTSIGSAAFDGCSNIETVTIKGCPNIDDRGFAGCPRISNVYVHSMEAPHLGNGVFEEEVKQSANLHIPTETEDVYSAAYGWREFLNVKADINVNEDVVDDGIQYATSPNIKIYGRDGSLYISGLETSSEIQIYDLNGVLQLNENIDGDTRLNIADGVYVVKIGNRTFKVAM